MLTAGLVQELDCPESADRRHGRRSRLLDTLAHVPQDGLIVPIEAGAHLQDAGPAVHKAGDAEAQTVHIGEGEAQKAHQKKDRHSPFPPHLDTV